MLGNMKKLRTMARMSQRELADIIGVSQQSVNKYENHGVEPGIETLIKIADYFNVSVDYLIGRADSETNRENPGSVVLNEKERDFIFEFRRLSDSEKDSILTVISNYLNKK